MLQMIKLLMLLGLLQTNPHQSGGVSISPAPRPRSRGGGLWIACLRPWIPWSSWLGINNLASHEYSFRSNSRPSTSFFLIYWGLRGVNKLLKVLQVSEGVWSVPASNSQTTLRVKQRIQQRCFCAGFGVCMLPVACVLMVWWSCKAFHLQGSEWRKARIKTRKDPCSKPQLWSLRRYSETEAWLNMTQLTALNSRAGALLFRCCDTFSVSALNFHPTLGARVQSLIAW